MKSVIEAGHAEVNSTSLTKDWRNKYLDYLKTRKLPSDPKESRAQRTKAARFSLVEGALFSRTFNGPLARCLGLGDTEYALREVHEGTCGNHSGTKSMSSTGATPFSLVYEAEALIPVEVGKPSLRFQYATEESNGKAMVTSLELLDERGEAYLVWLAAQKQRIERYYYRRAILRYFKIGDLVLRKVTLHTRNLNEGKLGSNWEGLYRVIGITGKGSYKLVARNDVQLPNNLNMTHLKRYYC
uniref:Uncharacterized protein n=1 Tax=Nicotiana tabacum TaxID=4097 RepID=A0A1S3ZV07_TOBAC|nr:PREDICTED: uncharacterized protein LOC107790720 [Nicotiana tabacum]